MDLASRQPRGCPPLTNPTTPFPAEEVEETVCARRSGDLASACPPAQSRDLGMVSLKAHPAGRNNGWNESVRLQGCQICVGKWRNPPVRADRCGAGEAAGRGAGDFGDETSEWEVREILFERRLGK